MSVWLHLTAGRGPVECRLAVEGLVRALCAEAAGVGVEASVIDQAEAEQGLLSAVVSLEGDGAEALASTWRGTVQWTCPSPVRPGWKRKNWFVAVDLLEPARVGAGGIAERDLRWETFRASGAGGQHVNKTESAVRLRHLPTGIVVDCQSERSQHRNRAMALARLGAALRLREEEARRQAGEERWSQTVEITDRGGNAVRVYKGPGFTRAR